MQVLEFMERLNVKETGYIIAYIKDAFREIHELCREQVKEDTINIIAGVEDYHFPSDMINLIQFSINDNDNESYNTYNWRWEQFGRGFKLYQKSNSGIFDTPTVSVANGIKLRYTYTDYVFVYNPLGDNNNYDYVASDGNTAISTDEIVYIDTLSRKDYGIRGYYYKYCGSGETLDLSDIDYTGSDWTLNTQISNPNEESYINCDDTMIRAVEKYVKYKIMENKREPAIVEYLKRNYRIELEKIRKMRRNGEQKVSVSKKPFRLS